VALELYWGSGSPFSWRVMLTLALKRLPYESKLLEFSKEDHKSSGYLKLNPRAKVPTLKDESFVLYESLAIMAYLDRKYPDPPIFGRTQEETGKFGVRSRKRSPIWVCPQTNWSGRSFLPRGWKKPMKCRRPPQR
jgi:glutathione S-transferase